MEDDNWSSIWRAFQVEKDSGTTEPHSTLAQLSTMWKKTIRLARAFLALLNKFSKIIHRVELAFLPAMFLAKNEHWNERRILVLGKWISCVSLTLFKCWPEQVCCSDLNKWKSDVRWRGWMHSNFQIKAFVAFAAYGLVCVTKEDDFLLKVAAGWS